MPTNNSWQPKNAPAVKQEFAARSARPTPVSKPELDQLKSQREHPAPPTLKPTPPTPELGNAPQNVQRPAQIKAREARIQQIEERLGRQQGRAQTAFKTANVVPKPDPVSKGELVTQKQEIEQRQARAQYIEHRLAAKRDRARSAFNRSR